MRYIQHSDLRNGIGAQGFQGQEGSSQDDQKKSRYSVVGVCPAIQMKPVR